MEILLYDLWWTCNWRHTVPSPEQQRKKYLWLCQCAYHILPIRYHTYVNAYIHTYTYIRIHTHAYIHIYAYIRIYTYIRIRTHIHTFFIGYIYAYIILAYQPAYTHMHKHKYIHLYIPSFLSSYLCVAVVCWLSEPSNGKQKGKRTVDTKGAQRVLIGVYQERGWYKGVGKRVGQSGSRRSR